MAYAFRPSRSALYRSPENAAMAGIADTVMDELQDRSNAQVDAEYRRQVSNGTIARENERHNLVKMMQENQKDPASWRGRLAKDKDRIRKSIMAGITQPQAKQQVELELNEQLAAWDRWIDDEATKQTGINANADYRAGVVGYQQSTQYRDQTDFQSRVSAARLHVQSGFNGGDMPVDDLPTAEVAKLKEKQLVQTMTADYLVQEALATDNEKLLDEANTHASNLGAWDEGELFGPEELADMRKRYTETAKAAKAEGLRERQARADAFEQQATNALLSGKFTFKDDKGNDINWRDAIINNPDLTAEKKRTLEDEYTSQVNARSKGKTYTEGEKLEAYIAIRTETDPKKKLDLLKKNAPVLGFNEVQSLYDKMNKTTEDDSHLATGLHSAITAIRGVRTNGETDEKVVGKAHIDLLRVEDRILRAWENPELTAQQKLDLMEQELAPVKDEAAKETVSWVKDLLLGGGPIITGYHALRGRYSPKTDAATAATKNPTAGDLRRQNTREAYLKGVELGYWK